MSIRFRIALSLAVFLLLPGHGVWAQQTITIDGITVSTNVYGNGTQPIGDAPTSNSPTSLTGNPNGNTVNIQNAATVNGGGGVNGGYGFSLSSTAMADNNTITISNGSNVTAAYGGWAISYTGTAPVEAIGNQIMVTNSTLGSAYGGVANGVATTASSNTVVIDASMVNGGVVFGGYGSVSANNNTVTIRNGSTASVSNAVMGGYSNTGTTTTTAVADSNTVTIDASTVTSLGQAIFGGEAYSGYGNTETTGNNVTISSASTVTGPVYGGQAFCNDSGIATTDSNTVTLTGASTVTGFVYGGQAFVYSGSGTAEASSNNVIISGTSTATMNVYGGDAYY